MGAQIEELARFVAETGVRPGLATVLIGAGLDISPVITHRFSHRDFEEGFAIARSGRSGKVILDWMDV